MFCLFQTSPGSSCIRTRLVSAWYSRWTRGFQTTARWPWPSWSCTRKRRTSALCPRGRVRGQWATRGSASTGWRCSGTARTALPWSTPGNAQIRAHTACFESFHISRFLVRHACWRSLRLHVISRLIPIHESGWKSFDVTQAVHYWSKNGQNTQMHLEVWIEGERPGSYAAEMAKRVQFTTQEPSDVLGKPELILYTLNLEEFG